MADAKRKTSRGDSGQDAAQSPPAGPNEIGEGFLSVHRNYMKSLQEAHARAQQRYSQAQADYMRTLYDAQLSSQRAQEDAHRSYITSMQDACAKEDAQQLVREAEQRYVKEFESGQSRARQALEEAKRNLSAALKEANDEANKAWDQARLTYLKGVQDRFTRVDPQALEPDVIALIGQSLVAASDYARRMPAT